MTLTEITNDCIKYKPRCPKQTHSGCLYSIAIDDCNARDDRKYCKCNSLVGLFVCMPCTIILDVTCCIPMTFGCYEINTPGFWMFTL